MKTVKGEDIYKRSSVLLVLIFALALGLRLWGIDFGLGLDYHSDEQFKLKDIIALLSGHSLEDALSYAHPTFMRRFVAVVLHVFTAISTNAPDYETIHVISRICIALLGALTVVPVFLIGKELVSEKLGLLAALVLALVPTHVIHSHYLKEDIPQTFWLAFFLFFAIKIIRSGSITYYAFSGLVGGLALATKYPSAVMVTVPLVAAHILNCRKEKSLLTGLFASLRDRRLWLAMFTVVLTFAIFSFDALRNIHVFLQGIRYEFSHAFRGHFGIRISSLPLFFTYHLRFSLWPGMTPFLLMLSFAGMIAALYLTGKDRERLEETGWVIFTLLVFYFTVEIPLLKPPGFQRYVIPCVPLLSLFAAWAFLFFIGNKNMPVKVAGVFISSLIVFYAGIMSSRYVNEMVPDTRDVAAGWIEKWMYEDVSPDASIMLFGQYDSNLPYRVIKSRTFSDRISWSSSLDDMLMRKPDYIVVSSLNYDRYFQYKMYGDRYSMDLEIYYKFYRILFETHRPVMSFSSSLPRLGINNPVILVYRVDYEKLKALWTM